MVTPTGPWAPTTSWPTTCGLDCRRCRCRQLGAEAVDLALTILRGGRAYRVVVPDSPVLFERDSTASISKDTTSGWWRCWPSSRSRYPAGQDPTPGLQAVTAGLLGVRVLIVVIYVLARGCPTTAPRTPSPTPATSPRSCSPPSPQTSTCSTSATCATWPPQARRPAATSAPPRLATPPKHQPSTRPDFRAATFHRSTGRIRAKNMHAPLVPS